MHAHAQEEAAGGHGEERGGGHRRRQRSVAAAATSYCSREGVSGTAPSFESHVCGGGKKACCAAAVAVGSGVNRAAVGTLIYVLVCHAP